MLKKITIIMAGIRYIIIFCCSFAFMPRMPMYESAIAVIATSTGNTKNGSLSEMSGNHRNDTPRNSIVF
jgi:hypothetical protein